MDDVPESMGVEELASVLGVTTRTLRAWVSAGLLPRPTRKGPMGRFDRASIVRAHAVAALRRDRMSIPLVARFLEARSEAELRELAGLPQLPKPPTRALPPPSSPGPSSLEPVTPKGRSSVALPGDADPPAAEAVVVDDDEPHEGHAAPQATGVAWRRIELVPGLELHVRDDAPPFVHSLAAAIAAGRFGR